MQSNFLTKTPKRYWPIQIKLWPVAYKIVTKQNDLNKYYRVNIGWKALTAQFLYLLVYMEAPLTTKKMFSNPKHWQVLKHSWYLLIISVWDICSLTCCICESTWFQMPGTEVKNEGRKKTGHFLTGSPQDAVDTQRRSVGRIPMAVWE